MSIRRKIMRKYRRKNEIFRYLRYCPECHAELDYKPCYGKICPVCGWYKPEPPKGE